MRDDRGLGFTVLAAAAFAVVLAGCSFFGGSTKETWATAHPAKAPATEPTPQPSAMAERAEAAVPPPASFAPRAELVDLRFRSGQIEVTKTDHATLEAVVRWMKAHPTTVVMIVGHTDDLGSRTDNLAIGEKRAQSIEKYLLGRGIEPGRLSVASVGSDAPVCEQKTDACRAKNRRARFLVSQP
ncbi:MAG TPA: OmpA family protein [Methylomirabilota bacterium]|nr:OmpA family protein [Methylomirabilota bacterium]